MLILGIDTSTKCGSVGLINESEPLGLINLNVNTTHSERLMLSIDTLLKWTKVSLTELAAIAVTKGPGSFTGLRISASVAKGLTFANNLQLVSCSTLEAMAKNIVFSPYSICPIIDAKRNEIYTALFKYSCSGILNRLTSDKVTALGDFLKDIVDDTIFLGNTIARFEVEIKNALGEKAHFISGDKNFISAINVAYIGMEKLRREEVEDIRSFAPLYLRKSDAEIALEKRIDKT